MRWGLLDGPERLELEEGRQLKLLSAFEVLEARAEARQLVGDEREMALCANACLLAKAIVGVDGPQFRDGEQVLAELTVEEIQHLAGVWAEFNRRANPGPQIDDEQVDALKKAWSTREGRGCTGACCERFRPCRRRNGPFE